MIPNPAWFPTAFQARADWYSNFSNQFGLIGLSLGFTQPELDAVEADNEVMQFLRQAYIQMNAISDAARQFRLVITEGAIGEAKPAWPAQFAGVPPDPLPATGIYERLDDLVKRIRSAPNYSPETGALLGIIPVKPDPIAPEAMKPEPSLTASPGNKVNVKFTKGKTSGVELEVQVDNSGTWQNFGRFIKSPAELTIPENDQSLPRSVQVRARYLQGNMPVGQYSDVDVIATTP